MRAETLTHLNLFIAYTSDVQSVVDHAQLVVQSYNRSTSNLLGLYLNVTTWQDVKTDPRRGHGESFQSFINRAIIDECHILVLVGGERYGTLSRGHQISNFEREVKEALRVRKRRGDFVFLPFLKVLKQNNDAGPQRMGIARIRKTLEHHDVVFHSFTSPAEFVNLFSHELHKTVINQSLMTPKVRALRKFFAFSPHPDASPDANKLIITFPSMDRKYMGGLHDSGFWKQRLVPNLVFEDYKALAKIEKCIRLIRFRDFKIRSAANIVENYRLMNRFWICLPRNSKARKQLAEKYTNVSRFSVSNFDAANSVPLPFDRQEKIFIWRTDSKKQIRVRSPLSKYLVAQRLGVNIDTEWNGALRDIVARDFAVLARFTDVSKESPLSESGLKDFFLGGIRGLGTWGAAWFLDRKYHLLERLEQRDGNFQVLLQVTYRNGRISEVIDVSNKEQDYFDMEMSDEYIKDVVENHETSHE